MFELLSPEGTATTFTLDSYIHRRGIFSIIWDAPHDDENYRHNNISNVSTTGGMVTKTKHHMATDKMPRVEAVTHIYECSRKLLGFLRFAKVPPSLRPAFHRRNIETRSAATAAVLRSWRHNAITAIREGRLSPQQASAMTACLETQLHLGSTVPACRAPSVHIPDVSGGERGFDDGLSFRTTAADGSELLVGDNGNGAGSSTIARSSAAVGDANRCPPLETTVLDALQRSAAVMRANNELLRALVTPVHW